jgi:Tfp pilus assembly protein PilE
MTTRHVSNQGIRMAMFQRLLLVAALATLTFAGGCKHRDDKAIAVDPAALARANAQISQPAWLRERLPEHTVAYARIPTLWGTLSAPDGRLLDAALVNDQHVQIIAGLRKAVHGDPLIAQTGAGPVIELLLGDQGAPLEIAVIDASDGVSPFSRTLATTVLDFADIAALNARVAAISGPQSPLQAPFDANGNATLKRFGALHFDTQTHRLYVSIGTTASALTLEQDLEQLKTTRVHPMQEAEREIDNSGQGLFVWMSAKGLNTMLAERLPQLPPDSLLQDYIMHAQSIALGWGTVDGRGRLQLQIRAPQSRLLAYLAPNAGEIDLKTAGKPEWAITMALPGADNLQAMRDGLDRDYIPGLRSRFDAGMAQMRARTGIDPIEFAKLVGPHLVVFSDANGSFTAVRVRDRKALYAKLDELGKRFRWRSGIVQSGGAEIHELHIQGIDAPAGQAGMDPKARAWMQLYSRIGNHLYWVEDGDYLVFARVPQLLVDRVASRPGTSLGAWLHDSQSYSSVHTVLGVTATTHNMQREVYYSYLSALQILGDVLGQPVDLTTLPSAGQLKLPVEGATGISLEATDQQLALQVTYEQSPIEGVVGGGGNTMTTVAVVAIVSAIAIAQYQDYVIRSQVSEGSALADGAKTAMAEFYANKGYFPASNASAGLAAASSITGQYVSSVSLGTMPGTISVTYSNSAPHKANLSLDGKRLLFEAQTMPGSIEWHCKSPDLKQKWCASSCECKG